jgi:MOSC domain-containing protein
MVAGTIAEIWRYPVKSMAGERLDSCVITETGLDGDRRWALVDGTVNRAGKLFTNTQDARLMTYRARMVGHGVEVSTPRGLSRDLDDQLVAELGREVSRPLTLRDTAGVNFDDSPVLVVNLATVAAFALAAGMPVDHRRFRGNLYVEGFESDEEVRWFGSRIRVGAVQLEPVKRCERCVVITRDPETTVASPALLRVLTETSETFMGIYCRVVRPGMVSMGDLIGPE